MRDSDGLPYSGNIERGAESVVQAVVDLLLLAASTPVLTSPSSFLALAIRLRKSGAIAQQLAAPSPTTTQQEVMDLLALLRPFEMTSDHKVRIGGDADGGYVMPSLARKTNAVVSIGIGDQVSFDAELADLGATVLQFDHTIPGAPLAHERLRFHHQGWGPHDEGPLLSLHTMMQGIDWPQARHPVLKFDTEGAEWDALAATSSEDLARFDVIAGEFHGFHNLNHRSVYDRIRAVLEKSATRICQCTCTRTTRRASAWCRACRCRRCWKSPSCGGTRRALVATAPSPSRARWTGPTWPTGRTSVCAHFER